MGTNKLSEQLLNLSRWENASFSAEGSQAAAHGGGLDPERLARLVRTIEGEIVPRLIVSRRLKAAATAPECRYNGSLDELDVKEFVRLLLAHESGVASAYVDTVRTRGVTLDAICLDLLAPAARELGLLWEEDECDFMQVTVGLCRLHQVLRELSPAFDNDGFDERDRGILLTPYPGEQHTFGVMLVAQFLRRAGWEVTQAAPETVEDLLALTREHAFALVGISVGSDRAGEQLADTIRQVRAASRNARVGVLVGGPTFVANPAHAEAVGADGTASNGREAVQAAERICETRAKDVSAARK